ncbi:hypothetical protein V8F33_005990 [Rhypophila sp. PSN 637]
MCLFTSQCHHLVKILDKRRGPCDPCFTKAINQLEYFWTSTRGESLDPNSNFCDSSCFHLSSLPANDQHYQNPTTDTYASAALPVSEREQLSTSLRYRPRSIPKHSNILSPSHISLDSPNKVPSRASTKKRPKTILETIADQLFTYPQMSSYKRDDWSQPSFPTNTSTSHRPLPPLPTSRATSNKTSSALPSAMKGHTHTPLPPLPTNGGRSHIMKPLPAVPPAMNRKPPPALPPTMNGNMPSGTRRRNSFHRVSFSNITEDDSRPRFRNPKGQTYPRGCLNQRSAPAKHVSPAQPRTIKPSAVSETVPRRAKPNHLPGEKCKDLACSSCKAKIADWISDTSERIALDEGMPPESLSISAFQRVFYEDEDTACAFKPQTAEASTQVTVGNEREANNIQEGVLTQIMRIIAQSLLQKVEDPYEVHARKRRERQMRRIMNGGEVDGDKKRRRRKRSVDNMDLSVKTFFGVCIALLVVGVWFMFAMDFLYIAGVIAAFAD